MPKTNRKCHFCDKEYYYCPNCRDKRDPKIYSMFDSEKCKVAFNILKDEYLKKISTKEACDKLLELGITEASNISNKHLQRVLAYSSTTSNKEIVKDLENEIENSMVEEVAEKEEIVEEQLQEVSQQIKKPESYKRFKKRNKNSEVIEKE